MNEFGEDQQGAPPPPPPAGPGGGEAPGNAWEQRDRLGFGGGLIGGVKQFITSPGTAYEQSRKTGDFISPLLFAILVGWFGALLGQIWNFLFQGTMMGFVPPEFRDQMAMYAISSPAMLAVNLVLTPIYLSIGLFIGSAIHHFCLMLVGALGNSDSGYEGTFRINGYAFVTQLAQVIPLIGWMVSFVWFVALQVIGATRMHGTTTGRALFAALIPWIVCCACFGIFFAIMGAAVMSSFQ